MENIKINVAELLKDCPLGMKLDCTMYSQVLLMDVDDYKKTNIQLEYSEKMEIV